MPPGPCGEVAGSVRTQKQEQGESTGRSLYCVFRGKGKLNVGSLNNSSGLWGLRAVLSCLAPGPGLIRAGEMLAWCVRVR